MEKNKADRFSMSDMGIFRIAVSSPEIVLGDVEKNTGIIVSEIEAAQKKGVSLILFPQLTLTGCSCGVLFYQELLLQKTRQAIKKLAKMSCASSITAAVGFPYLYGKKLLSAAAVISSGAVCGIVPMEVSDVLSRYFDNFKGNNQLTGLTGFKDPIPFGMDLDFYVHTYEEAEGFCFSFNGSSGAEIILAPMAEPSFAGSMARLELQFKNISALKNCCAAFSNCGMGESGGAYLFAGETGIFENGKEESCSSILQRKPFTSHKNTFLYADIDVQMLRNIKRKNRLLKNRYMREVHIGAGQKAESNGNALNKVIPKNPFLPECGPMDKKASYKKFFYEIISFQAAGLARRLQHIRCGKCILGISGGLDSSAALLVSAYCFKLLNLPLKNIYAVTMPGLGTTCRTKDNAKHLALILGCTFCEIPITEAVMLHFKDIGHDTAVCDAVFENAQARERTQILTDKANQLGAIMVGSGDLSEAALGWMTYGGDHLSMYEVNASIPKTMLKDCLTAFIENKVIFDDDEQNEALEKIIKDIITTPVSPELLPPENGNIAQKTEAIIGPYELHDFFLYHAVHNAFPPKKIFYLARYAFKQAYTDRELVQWLTVFYKRFFSQQFKRSCSPEGAAVTELSLSVSAGWTMPSDASVNIWIKELDLLSKMI